MRYLVSKLTNKRLLLIVLFLHAFLFLLVSLKINFFRYNNFDFGKFDLGNMTQMVWNVLHGNGLSLTDYFGTNLPRWAMSHVDPILYLFVPVFAVFPHPMTLVVSQVILITFSCYVVFLIARLRLKSDLAAFFIASAFLLYPAIGFLSAWTGFHGVTAVIPFFFIAFYLFEKMYFTNTFTKKNILLFWLFIVLSAMGKEQVSAYIAIFGGFIYFYRPLAKKLGLQLFVLGSLWFSLCFFVIIPHYASYRVAGYEHFAERLGIAGENKVDVSLPNYFLSRYDDFGDSYLDIFINVVLDYKQAINVFFGGDRLENFAHTFVPVLYLPLLYPQLLILSAPDFFANYLTTASGVGTSEIYNHRISMIVPVLFISTIYAIGYIADWLGVYKSKIKFTTTSVIVILSLLVLISSLYTTYKYENPIYLWITQAVKKRLPVAFAKTAEHEVYSDDLNIGDVVRLTPLEEKDRECANQIVSLIPDYVSVSGPDYLGAHLSMRQTYAIFPALFDEADYVIVDVFSQKISRILDLDLGLVPDVIENLIKNKDYEQLTACGNLYVFKRVGAHEVRAMLPQQERRTYEEKVNYLLMKSVYLVDYDVPSEISKNESTKAKFVYSKKDNDSLESFVFFTTFINKVTGEIYQVANLPSFAFITPDDWLQDYYYIEEIDINVPDGVDAGVYKLFVGATNKISSRSIYLGEISLK